MSFSWNAFLVVSIIFSLLGILIQVIPRSNTPSHLLGHAAFAVDELIPAPLVKDLIVMMKEQKYFHSNVDQSKAQGFKPVHEDFGEAQPIEPDGTCKHSLLFPNIDKTKCIFPQRVDVGKFFLLTGGLDGIKENYHDLIDRVSSFGQYNFVGDMVKFPLVKKLFNSEKFQTAAKSVCHNYDNNTVLDTFQFNFIMQVPGQTVAAHLDSPYFWGGSRFQFPQWLLVAMVFSGLFQEKFIHQIQVVGYIHEWNEEDAKNPNLGGDFVYYLTNNANEYGIVNPKTGAGTFVDGSKVLHAAKVYRPDVKAPHLDKDKDCVLTFLQDEDWAVLCGENDVRGRYKTHDLRISVVYRARCFKDQEESDLYQKTKNTEMFQLDYIIETFQKDLIEKKGYKENYIKSLSRLDLGLLIMDTYITYPLPPIDLAVIPYNYCAIPLLYPWTEKFFSLICK